MDNLQPQCLVGLLKGSPDVISSVSFSLEGNKLIVDR